MTQIEIIAKSPFFFFFFFQPRRLSHIWKVQGVGRRGRRIRTDDIRGSSSISVLSEVIPFGSCWTVGVALN